jgi:hypothetical protein
MVSEEAIRQRSYEIWQREGRPEGRAVEHWLQAKVELENEQKQPARPKFRILEYHTMLYRFEEWQRTVQPKPRITRPPQILMAERISRNDRPAAA